MNKYKKLKEAILSISDNKRQSISKAERESFAVFIEVSLLCALMNIRKKYSDKGYSESEIGNCLFVKKPIIDVAERFIVDEDKTRKIDVAYRLYAELVKDSEPFTDVLSMLHEEILLSGGRGEGLGQFFTPPDLARSLAMMLFNETTQYPSGTIRFSEPCCGSGALALSPLNQMYKTAPERLRDVHLMLNDIDSLAVKSAILQVLMTCIYHNIELSRVDVYNANLITEYSKGDTFFMAFETPKEKPEAFRAFEEMMRLVLEVERDLQPEYA
ncbi:MAG: N-6 DNA methylase [Pseudomonas sp.]|uniref:N-6 DNA methylase n=1 Tax=Pseudomonas sp. TaxID=306 RepID=UPI0039827732